MEHRPVHPAFVFAWVFLVLIVAGAFFVQAATIRRIERDEDAISELVREVDLEQEVSAERFCALLVQISEPQEANVIIGTFQDLGYACPVPTEGG